MQQDGALNTVLR
jgi:IS5 family transposase